MIGLILPYTVQAQAISDYNVVSHWSCDEVGGGIRYDSHANGNHLSDTNTVGTSTGLLNVACDFEADNNEYLSIADGSQIGLDLNSGDASFSFWANVESHRGAGSYARAVINKGWKSGALTYLVRLVYNANADTLLTTRTGSINNEWNYTWTQSLGTWYHFVFTHDSSTGLQTLYVDGVEVASSTEASGSFDDTSNAFYLGVWDSNVGLYDYFDGDLDEITVFNELLDSNDVVTIYNGGTPLPYTATVSTTTTSTQFLDDNTIFMLSAVAHFILMVGTFFMVLYVYQFIRRR